MGFQVPKVARRLCPWTFGSRARNPPPSLTPQTFRLARARERSCNEVQARTDQVLARWKAGQELDPNCQNLLRPNPRRSSWGHSWDAVRWPGLTPPPIRLVLPAAPGKFPSLRARRWRWDREHRLAAAPPGRFVDRHPAPVSSPGPGAQRCWGSLARGSPLGALLGRAARRGREAG